MARMMTTATHGKTSFVREFSARDLLPGRASLIGMPRIATLRDVRGGDGDGGDDDSDGEPQEFYAGGGEHRCGEFSLSGDAGGRGGSQPADRRAADRWCRVIRGGRASTTGS
jgi:hypothetical protein